MRRVLLVLLSISGMVFIASLIPQNEPKTEVFVEEEKVEAPRSVTQDTTITLQADYDTVCDWIEANNPKIQESSGSTTLEVNGMQSKLEKVTVKGTYVFTIQRINSRGCYRSKLIERHSGNLVGQTSEILVKKIDSKTVEVTIAISAQVENLSNFYVIIGVRRSVRGIQRLFEETFPQPPQFFV